MPVLDLETLKLDPGAHEKNAELRMCVMEAVAFVAGESWTDSPESASPVIAAFMRPYHDSVDDEKRQSLKQYIPRLIGTRGSEQLEERRALIAADWIVRIHTPAWLRLAGLTVQADALASLPEITSMVQVRSIKWPLEVVRQYAVAAIDAAGAAAWDAAGDAAIVAAWDAAWDAARATTRDAAIVAAWDAAGDAARATARAAAIVAAGAKLKPTVDELQATVPALIERMLAATE